MQCTNCQKEIAENSRFCNYCGAMQIVTQTGTGRKIRSSHTRRTTVESISRYSAIPPQMPAILRSVEERSSRLQARVPIVPAIIAYLVARLVMPESPALRPAVSNASPSASPNMPHPTQAA
jgi:hypothetical protein